jgi:hypothetical protein
MKKLIAIAFFAIVAVNSYAQEKNLLDSSSLYKSLADNIFEDYKVGANDSQSIGILKTILINPEDKYTFLKVNFELSQLTVTGTASPFHKRVSFDTWINDYVIAGEYGDNCITRYRCSNRSDGMVQEFLTVEKIASTGEKVTVRVIIISRLKGSIISVWDSKLN